MDAVAVGVGEVEDGGDGVLACDDQCTNFFVQWCRPVAGTVLDFRHVFIQI